VNRAQRRAGGRRHLSGSAAVAFARSYSCPDCSSDQQLLEEGNGLYVLEVAHDPTCPWLAARQRGRG
jgi:hypothetical protein